MPLDITSFTFVDKPTTLKENLAILERDDYRCQYCGLDGRATFENGLVMRVDFVMPRAKPAAAGKRAAQEQQPVLEGVLRRGSGRTGRARRDRVAADP